MVSLPTITASLRLTDTIGNRLTGACRGKRHPTIRRTAYLVPGAFAPNTQALEFIAMSGGQLQTQTLTKLHSEAPLGFGFVMLKP